MISKKPLEYILEWYNDLPKDLQSMIAAELNLYNKSMEENTRIEFYTKPIEIFRKFLNKPPQLSLEYISHIIFVKGLIDYFFLDKETADKWGIIMEKYLEEIHFLEDPDYMKKIKGKMSSIPFNFNEEYRQFRIKTLEKYLNDFDKDSVTYIDAYGKWLKLCSSHLSNKRLKKLADMIPIVFSRKI